MEPSGDISGNLAERYCDMLEAIDEIDLDALDRKIERMVRLRDAVRKLRCVTGPTSALQVAQPAPPPTKTRRRRPMGFWPDFIEQSLRDGPRTLKQMLAGLSQQEPSDYASILGTLSRCLRRFELVPDTNPKQFRIIASTLSEMA